MEIWKEEDKIAIESDITCVIYSDMPGKRFGKKKDNTSEDEVALKLVSYLSFDERGDAELVESQVADFIYDNANDDNEGKFDIPPSKKRRGEIDNE